MDDKCGIYFQRMWEFQLQSKIVKIIYATRRVDGNADILSHLIGNNILYLGVT